ncbi:MAG: branched-chain amino acid ABC transporter permease [Actinomycetota bacterium]
MDWGDAFSNGLIAAIGPIGAAYAISTIGLNLQFGYTGLLNFGHVAFMMMGAYGMAATVAAGGSMWLGIAVGIGAAVVLGLLLGIPTLRLRADYLAITTIAAAESLRFLIRSPVTRPVTGGVFGIQGFASEFHALNPFGASALFNLGPIDITGRRLWVMLVGWTLVVVLILISRRLIKSPWGRLVRAIREDEDASRSLGKNVFAVKLQALTLGGALGAMGGILIAIEQQNVTPDNFLPQLTFILFVVMILGGTGTIWGPLVGAIVFQFFFFFFDTMMREAQRNVDWVGAILDPAGAGQMRFVLVGVALIALLVFRPQGILGNREEAAIDA